MSEVSLAPVWVIIPAAGVGKRMKLDRPKQYLKINNKTLIEHTLACFSHHPEIAGIIVALDPDDPYWKLLDIDTNSIPVYTVDGGMERSDSVTQALDYLALVEQVSDDTWVMVHDAARPYLSQDDLDALLKIRHDNIVGGLLAAPVKDTMKRSLSERDRNTASVSHTEPRENLWHALTPQMFNLGKLREALVFCQDKNIAVTDEASAIEALGDSPVLVEGSHNNIKVTHPSDIELVQCLLSNNNKNEAYAEVKET